MGRASDAAKLMAIGLLNFADDKGYFYHDRILIRNAIRPFDEDSVSTHGALTELSLMGYFEIRTHQNHGEIGKIMAFERHQVINRPSKHSMKELWDSCVTHGALSECSLNTHPGRERKGTGNREGKEPELEMTTTPEPLPKNKARGSEEEFRQYAKELNLPENDGYFLFSKFEESNWTKNQGKDAIKDWKATMRVWKASRWLPSQKNITEKGRRGFQDEFKYKQNGHTRRPHD